MSLPEYELVRSGRKTLAVEITGDCRVVVRAPARLIFMISSPCAVTSAVDSARLMPETISVSVTTPVATAAPSLLMSG